MDFYNTPAENKDYETKIYHGNIESYDTQRMQQLIMEQNTDKINSFKERLSEFEHVGSLEDAKQLAKKIMPVKEGRTTFQVGDAKCIIINGENMLRITLKSNYEFISYNFV